nr:MAG TPA: hypothetical protein [Caudoviricetes sp.]
MYPQFSYSSCRFHDIFVLTFFDCLSSGHLQLFEVITSISVRTDITLLSTKVQKIMPIRGIHLQWAKNLLYFCYFNKNSFTLFRTALPLYSTAVNLFFLSVPLHHLPLTASFSSSSTVLVLKVSQPFTTLPLASKT